MSDLMRKYILKQRAKIEADNHDFTPHYWKETINIDGALAAGDGQARFVADVDCRPISAAMTLETTGDTGGATTVVLAHSNQTDWSVAGTDPTGGQLSIAHTVADAEALDSVNVLDGNWVGVNMAAGDMLYVNIDAIPTGTTSTNLTVTVGFITR